MTELSVISTTTVVRGNVRGQGSLRVDGRVHGNIEVTGDVALGPDAEVQGNISGASIAIAGIVSGDLTGTEAVMIEAGAKVIGDLRAPRIGIGDGAQVRGSVETGEAPAGATTSFNAARSAARPAPRAATSIARPGLAVGSGSAARPAPMAPREAAAPARSAAAVAAPATRKDGEGDEKPIKRSPPPPVVVAPRAGAKGRKKRTKDD